MSYFLLIKAWPKNELSKGSKIISFHTGIYQFSHNAHNMHNITITYILLVFKDIINENS